jgi:two-component system, chemotaxis family, protein-glutamate methylesterase/glutaminase
VSGPIRVVVVEDSPTQAAHIRSVLEEGGAFDVVGVAADVGEAVAAVSRHRPDAVTMDLEIPGGGGQLAIERIMAAAPTPILLLSQLVDSAAAPSAIDALAAGAVDVLPKPQRWTAADAEALRRNLRAVSAVPVVARRRWIARPGIAHEEPLVALAASTGGPRALATVLAGMGPVAAPVLVVQHIHPRFVDSLGAWLGEQCGVPVQTARDGDRARAGHVYLAPGEAHLKLGPRRRLVLDPEPPRLHRPSADVLFESVARHAGPAGVAAVLTGMGRDGAAGLLAIRQAGGRTFAQDEATSVIFGMPGAARELGAAATVAALDGLGPAIARAVERITR